MGIWEVWRVDDSARHATSLLTFGDQATAEQFAAGRRAGNPLCRYVVLPLGGSPFDEAGDDEGQAVDDGDLFDDVRHAHELAALMTHWLAEGHSLDDIPSDVIEWCRSARDLLTRMGVRS